MSKLGSQSFHVPQTPRGSDSEDKDTGLLGPPLLPVLCGYPQSVGKKHPHAHFPKCNSNSAWLPPSLSAATRKDLGAALLELQEGIAGERARRRPQEILDIGASVSYYWTTARLHENYARQSTPPRVPWKLFQKNHQHSAGTETLLYGSMVFTSCLESFWEVRSIYIITK